MDRAITAAFPSSEADAIEIASPQESHSTALVIDNMQCGACMAKIERTLRGTAGVHDARANLSARRASVTYDPQRIDVQRLIEALEGAGFRAAEAIDSPDVTASGRAEDLLRRLGVAGFAAANVMLLSVSVWAGIASDMEQAAADLFHWLSALIAMPAIAYAGQPFFRSAVSALKARRLNMDVPISLGITLATAVSLFQTVRGTEQVYFDAAIMLTFFLLIGRTLDEQVRVRARGAAENLLGLKALTANVLDAEGVVRRVPGRLLKPGMRVQVATGERIPVDGRIIEGKTEIDMSLISGETIPSVATVGDLVHAGTVNLSRPVTIEATATDENTLLAEIAHLMQSAEQGRAHYVRLADRAARLYAPAVHLLGATTFVGWMVAGAGWEQALTYAIAVLIITCPCALALAVPAVQVAATSRLFAKGVIVKAPDGLERLSEVDTVVLDKTGTLTRGEPRLTNASDIDDASLAGAASLAVTSRHPYSRAVAKEARDRGLPVVARAGTVEVPGCGLLARDAAGATRLGSAAWIKGASVSGHEPAALWYVQGDAEPVGFRFEDAMRPDAPDVVTTLRQAGYLIFLLSGDRGELSTERSA